MSTIIGVLRKCVYTRWHDGMPEKEVLRLTTLLSFHSISSTQEQGVVSYMRAQVGLASCAFEIAQAQMKGRFTAHHLSV